MNQTVFNVLTVQDIGGEDAFDGSFAPPEGPAFHLGTFGFANRVPSGLLGLLLFLCLLVPVHAFPFLNKPGEKVDVTRHLAEGKVTVVFFHAPWSKTSGRYKVDLSKWSAKQSKVEVVGVRVKKLTSPVAKQYKLKSVPAFLVFDDEGEQTHSGEAATAEVLKMMKQR